MSSRSVSRSLVALLLATSALGGPAARADKKEREVVFPVDIRVERDVAYLPPDRSHKADLYFPKDMAPDARLPAVIIIHGGGFNDGDKDRRREINIGSNLARRRG